jgi:hypothetical protein
VIEKYALWCSNNISSTTFTPPKAPTLQNPTLMDIDTTRKKHDTPDTCQHWEKDCECRFDIQYMLAKEREEWLQNLALEADKEKIEKREEVESESVLGF